MYAAAAARAAGQEGSMRMKSGMLGSKALLALLLVAFAASESAALEQEAAWVQSSETRFGAAIATGDVNCDGVADLIAGNPAFDGNRGMVAIWYGGKTLPPQPTAPADWSDFSLLQSNLGTSVAAGDLNGDGCDDVIVGAPNDVITQFDGSRVFVYLGDEAGPGFFNWQASGLNGLGPYLNRTRFGESVAAGDVNSDGIADVIVGAPRASGGATGEQGEGVVHVWFGSQSFPVPFGNAGNVDWFGSGDQVEAHLGASVASASDLDGDGDDEVFAGAPDLDGTGGIDAGAAFAWFGSSALGSALDGTPANASFSFEIAAAAGAHVGASVAGVGDVDADGFADLVIGAPDVNGTAPGLSNGRAWWVRGQAFGPVDNSFAEVYNGDFDQGRLGTSVSAAGDVNGDGRADFMIGEPGPGRSKLVIGRTSMLPMSEMVWDEAIATHGAVVAAAGDWNDDGFADVAVGEPGTGVNPSQGSVRVYLGSGETLAAAGTTELTGINAIDSLGLGMGYAGDINHDGCSDFVAGAPGFDNDQTNEGRVFVRYGVSDACTSFNELILPGHREGNQDGAELGWSATGAGDVNGDGYGDVIAGAPFHDGIVFCGFPLLFCPTPDSGRADIFLGNANGMAFTASWTLEGLVETGAQFGSSAASAGDVNGDGFGDVIVGAPNAANGRAFLYLGSASGLSASHSWSATGTTTDARLGSSVAGVGDVNGDGYSDVLVGAANHGGTGAAFLYLGQLTYPFNPKGLGALPVRTYTGAPGSSFGNTVAAAGDLNRDGKSDFAIGAPTYDSSGFGLHEGEVTVYHGAPTSALPTVASQTLHGDAPVFDWQRFGSGIAGGGDVNGDGFGDLLVGDQWHWGPAGFAQGKAYLYHGGVSGVSTTAVRTFEDCGHSFCDFGRDVSLAGDVDGDGFSDALIGGYRTDADRGAIYVHLGNGGFGFPADPGVALLPLQARAFGGNPLAIFGDATNFFEPSIDLHSPAGRTNVSMELESKSLGQDFDNQNVTTSVFEDNGLLDRGALTVPIGVGQKVHWRARLRSASPLFGWSRWVHLPGNAARELDVRMVPEPEALLGLAAGGVMLTLLAHRRARATRSTRSVG